MLIKLSNQHKLYVDESNSSNSEIMFLWCPTEETGWQVQKVQMILQNVSTNQHYFTSAKQSQIHSSRIAVGGGNMVMGVCSGTDDTSLNANCNLMLSASNLDFLLIKCILYITIRETCKLPSNFSAIGICLQRMVSIN